MKLFFLIERLNKRAGTERIAVDVANSLNEATGWDITFVVVDDDTYSAFPLREGISVISLRGKLSRFISMGLKLRKLIKKEKPNYIINVAVPMSRISLLATVFTDVKVVTWEHFNLFAGSRLGYVWRLCSAFFSQKTVVLTKRDRRSYPKVLQQKVITIYNFATDLGDSRANLNSNVAISVGRLTPQKGFDLLLSVWKLVIERNPNWELHIVGSGKDEIELKQMANQLKVSQYVKFIPATCNIADNYRQSSIYVMTSRFEGLPLVLIEAKQMGLPCISFNCPNGPDEIIRPTVDGEIVEAFQIEQMSQQILKLISDRRLIKLYGKNAQLDVQERFCKEKIINEWIKLLS